MCWVAVLLDVRKTFDNVYEDLLLKLANSSSARIGGVAPEDLHHQSFVPSLSAWRALVNREAPSSIWSTRMTHPPHLPVSVSLYADIAIFRCHSERLIDFCLPVSTCRDRCTCSPLAREVPNSSQSDICEFSLESPHGITRRKKLQRLKKPLKTISRMPWFFRTVTIHDTPWLLILESFTKDTAPKLLQVSEESSYPEIAELCTRDRPAKPKRSRPIAFLDVETP